MSGDLGADRPDVVTIVDAKVGTQKIDDRPIARGLPIGEAACLEDSVASNAVGMRQLMEETRLAYPRITHHGHDLAMPLADLFESGPELLHLRIAPDELAQAPEDSGLKPSPHLPRRDHLADLDGRLETSHRHGAHRLDLDEALHETACLRGDPDGSGRSELLHASRQMSGLAHRRVVHAEVRADGTNHHVTGVEADTDSHGDAVAPKRLARVSLHRLLHPQGSITSTDRVIFMRERGTEQRHDPVTHHLVHRPLVVVNRLHHALEHRIEKLAGLLGIAIGEELHRPSEVGEEDGDLLALPFQGRFGGEDSFGQLRRRVGSGRTEFPFLVDGRNSRLSTASAELLDVLIREAACLAHGAQRQTALTAKAAPLAILGLAPWTLHVQASREGRRPKIMRLLLLPGQVSSMADL